MPIGTPILAARAGRVVKVDDTFDGIGIQSNLIMIEHDGGQHSGYAHLRYRGALVKVGDWVQQGQAIAWSGMVGQTVFPHLHFFVTNKDQTASIPISFREVSDGVPRAGHFYKSENFETESNRSIINNN
jgi:murein DD-endopeptidase MepM/ murein hydrolase activator NlpD